MNINSKDHPMTPEDLRTKIETSKARRNELYKAAQAAELSYQRESSPENMEAKIKAHAASHAGVRAHSRLVDGLDDAGAL